MRTLGLSWAVALTLLAASSPAAVADEIPLSNSGVDGGNRVLTTGSSDPHFTLVEVPAGSTFSAPGPAIVQVPHPAYLSNDTVGSAGSAWIGPQELADAVIPVGTYVYRTTFSLAGLDKSAAEVMVRLASDNSLDDVRLNGVSLGITGGGFTSWLTTFTLDRGFISGVNTLDFVIANHGDDAHGFRVELSGSAPATTTSTTAITSLRHSGVDQDGRVLAPGAADPHYRLTQVPAGAPSPGSAIVGTPHPAYLANDVPGTIGGSSWIGVQQVLDAPLPAGAYVYETTFDLTGRDPDTASLSGNLLSDNSLDEIRLNGVSIGVSGGGAQSFVTPFAATSGFRTGVNTLSFLVANHDAQGGPTGFRVEVSGTAAPLVERASTFQLSLSRGSLKLAKKEGRDAFTARGVYLNRGDEDVDGSPEGLPSAACELRLGSVENPMVLTLTADRWKTKGKKLTWTSPRGATPKVRLVFDTRRNRMQLNVSRFTLPDLPDDGRVVIELDGESEYGEAENTWFRRNARKFVLR